jgi:hypothetical protein
MSLEEMMFKLGVTIAALSVVPSTVSYVYYEKFKTTGDSKWVSSQKWASIAIMMAYAGAGLVTTSALICFWKL